MVELALFETQSEGSFTGCLYTHSSSPMVYRNQYTGLTQSLRFQPSLFNLYVHRNISIFKFSHFRFTARTQREIIPCNNMSPEIRRMLYQCNVLQMVICFYCFFVVQQNILGSSWTTKKAKPIAICDMVRQSPSSKPYRGSPGMFFSRCKRKY
jgi:hypothetical protein